MLIEIYLYQPGESSAMKRIMHLFARKRRGFLEMLDEQAGNMSAGAKELKIFIDDFQNLERSERKSRAQSIKSIERKGDEIAREIFERLEKNKDAPFEKGDIRQITVILDDILDLVNDAASKFVILSIERIDNNIIKLVDLAVEIINEAKDMVYNFKKIKSVRDNCSKICGLESRMDEGYNEALSELFHFYKNSIDIMKCKEIYGLLEKIADKCKDAANAAESIANRHQ